MRRFYPFWFFFCAGWGYLLADTPEAYVAPWWHVIAAFPMGLLSFTFLVWLTFPSTPARRAEPPTFELKPWNSSTDLVLFIGVTFIFVALWGIALAVIVPLPGLSSALTVLGANAGVVTALFVSRRFFPAKFRP